MSTTDPVAERRRREAAKLGAPRYAVALVISGGVIAAGAGVLAAMLLSFGALDEFTEAAPFPWPGLGMVIGLPAIIIGMLVHTGFARKYTGRLLAYPLVGPLTLMLGGGAIGGWLGWFGWPAPSGSRPGGLWWLLPAGLTVLAVLSLIAGARGRIRTRAGQRTLAGVLTTGRITAGEITAIPEIGPESGGLLGEMVVRFVDDAGTERWVQRLGQWKRHELPKTGDTVAVLFDPTAPGDTKRIWIGPADGRTAEDFSRWSL